jgi:hypothetical protein
LNPIAKIPNALKVMSSASFSAYDCLERFIRVDSVASEASPLYDKLNRDDRRIDYVAASPHSLEPAYENPKPYPALSLPTSSNYLADSSSVKEIANPHIGPVLAHYDVVDRGMVSSLVKSLPPVTALTLVSAWAPILVNDENPFEGSRSASDYEMAPTGGFSSLKGSSAETNVHRPPAALTFNLGHHDEESLYDAMEGAAQPYDTMASFRSSNLAGDFDAKDSVNVISTPYNSESYESMSAFQSILPNDAVNIMPHISTGDAYESMMSCLSDYRNGGGSVMTLDESSTDNTECSKYARVCVPYFPTHTTLETAFPAAALPTPRRTRHDEDLGGLFCVLGVYL